MRHKVLKSLLLLCVTSAMTLRHARSAWIKHQLRQEYRETQRLLQVARLARRADQRRTQEAEDATT